MEKRYLLDTCIWRDFYEARYGPRGRPIGSYVADLLMKLIRDKSIILYSEILVKELRRRYSTKEIEDMLGMLIACGALIRIDITVGEFEEALRLSEERSLPLSDCINAVQARDHSASLVSQDAHILDRLSDIAEVTRPEDVS